MRNGLILGGAAALLIAAVSLLIVDFVRDEEDRAFVDREAATSNSPVEARRNDPNVAPPDADDSGAAGASAKTPAGDAPRTLSVHVVDTEGQDAPGIKVSLYRRGPFEIADLSSKVTDASGRVRLEADALKLAEGESELITEVAARITAAEPVAAAVLPEHLAGGTIELRLPPLGSVELRLLESDGSPCREDVDGLIQVDPRGLSGWVPFQAMDVRSHGGRLRFSPIALDLELYLIVTGDSLARAMTTTVTGPTAPGAVVTRDLRLPRRIPRIRGRIVDPAGRVLGSRPLTFSLQQQSAEETVETGNIIDLGDDGRFSILVVDLAPGFPKRNLQLSVGGDERRDFDVSDIDTLLEKDLGDIPFRDESGPAETVTAAGRTCDPDGGPMASVRLTLEERHEEHADPSLEWIRLAECESGADGSFRFTADPERDQLRVRARTPAGNQTFTTVPKVAAEDMTIVLPRGATLAGKIRIEDDRAGAVRVECDCGSDATVHLSRELVEADRLEPGTFGFSFINLPKDPARIRVVSRAGSIDILRLDGIELREGQAAPDPRLQSIDLRESLRAVLVRVVDPQGEPIWGATIFEGEAKGRGPVPSWTTNRLGEATLHLAGESLPVEFFAIGFKTFETRLTSSRRVVLEKL